MQRRSDRFCDQFRSLSRAEILAFLDSLYSMQGVETRIDDGSLHLRRSASEPPEILVPVVDGESDLPDWDVDTVVDATRESSVEVSPGVTVLRPADIYELARYGLDRETSDRLLSAHFEDLLSDDGGDVAVSAPPTAPASAPTPQDHPEGPEGESRTESGSPGFTDDTGRTREGTRATDDTDDASPRATWSRRGMLVAAGGVLGGLGTAAATHLFSEGAQATPVPGLDAEGIDDPGQLAAAHVAALRDRSYTLEVHWVVRDDQLDTRSSFSLQQALTADRTFLATVGTAGPDGPAMLGNPPASARFWSDGDSYYVNYTPDEPDSGTQFDPPRGYVGTWRYWAHQLAFGGQVGSSPEPFLRDLYETIPVRLHREPGVVRLLATGVEPRSPTSLGEVGIEGVGGVDLYATVDQEGRVGTLDLTFEAEDDEGRVHFTRRIDYTAVGTTSVSRPEWAH